MAQIFCIKERPSLLVCWKRRSGSYLTASITLQTTIDLKRIPELVILQICQILKRVLMVVLLHAGFARLISSSHNIPEEQQRRGEDGVDPQVNV
jgi:hypothetical protein